MFAFLTPVDGAKTDPLADAQAAERFWKSLPRTDPVMAQKVMSDALADLTTGGHPTVGHICALLVLGKRTRKLTEALLINYGDAAPRLQPLERKYWLAAFELSQSFRQCLLELMRCNRDGVSTRDWPEYAPLVLLRYFQHRQVESLLRPFVGPRPRLLYSSEVHEVYNYARAQGLASQPLVIRRFHEASSAQSTLEREYIHVLLVKLLRSAQLSPQEAFWVNRRIPGWCEGLRLDPAGPGQAPAGKIGLFVVEPEDPEGLARADGTEAKARLCLDPTPLLTRIREEIAALREAGSRATPSASFTPDRQLKLLRKVYGVLLPKQERVLRRGERRFVSTTVEAVMGLAQIVRALRHEQRQAAAGNATSVPEVEEITITEHGAHTDTRPAAPPRSRQRGSGRVRLRHRLVVPRLAAQGSQRLRLPAARADRGRQGDPAGHPDCIARGWRRTVGRCRGAPPEAADRRSRGDRHRVPRSGRAGREDGRDRSGGERERRADEG